MALTSPSLDDLSYDPLVALMTERIPIVAPDWTDWNDSDPGIAMIQLFAHMAEQVGYRLNRVPEKTYVEFLKLAGIRLRPAVAASTQMAFSLTRPAQTEALLIPAYARIDAKGGDGTPPSFETDLPLDVLPAQIAALVTTRHELLDINGADETGPTDAGDDAEAYIAGRFNLAWDGKTPKLKDMPTEPVPLFTAEDTETHTSLYIGLAFNQSPAAGFKGARASLHLQLDSEELPEEDDQVLAGGAPLSVVNAFPEGALVVAYHYWRPAASGGSWEPIAVIADETDGWTRAGIIRFDVPSRIGPIPDDAWVDVEPDLPHPLVGALKTPIADTPSAVPISGWLRVRFSIAPRVAIRSLSFNTVPASHLSTVQGERLGNGTGLPGQTVKLGNGNIADGTLSLLSSDPGVDDSLIPWQEVADFDTALPGDRVYALDREEGLLIFGDGIRGFPPQSSELLIAEIYRHGGGLSGDVGTGRISQPSGLPSPIGAAFNIVPARGGRDAETTEEAKARAPGTLRMRGRAVTAADYRDATLASPGVRVARAEVVPLRRPYPQGHQVGRVDAPGLDVTQTAPGAISVIVVPDEPGDYPLPTTTMLAAVAGHLDTLRLVTTEVHVTTPQYVRLHNFAITVRGEPGYTRTELREAIGDHLRRSVHVLTGGAGGAGIAFGTSLHHADLVAEVMRVPGVARVETLTCFADGQTPPNADRELFWRIERRAAVRLTNCIETAIDTDRIVMLPDEVPFIDPLSLQISVTGAP